MCNSKARAKYIGQTIHMKKDGEKYWGIGKEEREGKLGIIL